MPLPKSVTKIKKSGVEYTSNVDRAKYTMDELQRAALRDTGKYLRTIMKADVATDKGDLRKNIATWVIRKRGVLQIGVYDRQRARRKGLKYAGYYAHIIEFGSKIVRAQPFLLKNVMANIAKIREIQAKYLKSIEDEQKAKGYIDESEEIADD